MNLTELEEEAIVDYIIDLSARLFSPRLRGIEEVANHLLHVYDAPLVGKN